MATQREAGNNFVATHIRQSDPRSIIIADDPTFSQSDGYVACQSFTIPHDNHAVFIWATIVILDSTLYRYVNNNTVLDCGC